MTTNPSVADVRYVLTDAGRAALASCTATCACEMKIAGLLLECPHCGTVYGYLRNVRNSAPFNGKPD